MFNPFPVVRSDFRRNRLLVSATVLLVAIAVAIGIAVISQERALRQGSARAADDFDLVVGAPGSATQLILSTVYLKLQALPLLDGHVFAQITDAPGAAYAAPIAFGDNWHGYPIIGTIAEFASREGKLPLTEGRLFARRGEAVIGSGVKLAMGERVHPSHGVGVHDDEEDDEDHEEEHAHEHSETSYAVVGRLAPRHNIWDKAILVPVEDVWAVHGLGIGHAPGETRLGPPWDASRLPGVPAIAVKPKSVAAAYMLRNQFRTAHSLALFPAEVLNELYVTLGNIRDLMSLLALATQILVVASVLMALLVGFLAQQRQFAVLRAIGASRNYVFAIVWIEAVSLIAAGAAAGLLLGYAASFALAQWLALKTGFAMPLSIGTTEAALVGGLLLASMLVALFPAVAVFHRPIAASLRS